MRHKAETHDWEDEPAVIGTAEVVDAFLKSPKQKKAFAKDPLAAHIHQLLKLHPHLQVKFRDSDLASMDETTKDFLLEDIQSVLGISIPGSHRP